MVISERTQRPKNLNFILDLAGCAKCGVACSLSRGKGAHHRRAGRHGRQGALNAGEVKVEKDDTLEEADGNRATDESAGRGKQFEGVKGRRTVRGDAACQCDQAGEAQVCQLRHLACERDDAVQRACRSCPAWSAKRFFVFFFFHFMVRAKLHAPLARMVPSRYRCVLGSPCGLTYMIPEEPRFMVRERGRSRRSRTADAHVCLFVNKNILFLFGLFVRFLYAAASTGQLVRGI